jgi:putative hemolysin
MESSSLLTAIAGEVAIIFLLMLANGLFAMTEMAVVSSRKTRLKALAERGDKKARLALALAEAPDRFLPTVQIGITLVGLLAGAFGGITIAEQIAARLKDYASIADYAEAIGVGIVVTGLTFLSLVVGELVPKRLALANPEGIARMLAPPMDFLSRFARPIVRLLSASTEFVLWVLRIKTRRPTPVSEEEVKMLVQEGSDAGVFHHAEPRMVDSVLSLDHLPAHQIMTPREKITFLNLEDPHDAVWHKVVVSGHSNFPVYSGERDHIVGVVSVKAIYANLAAGIPVRLADVATKPLVMDSRCPVTQVLEEFKRTGQHTALLRGGDGKIVGLLTLVDLLEAIVGEIPSLEDRLKPRARPRPDGSWLVDALYDIDRLETLLGQGEFDVENLQGCVTLGDLVALRLGRAPREGDTIDTAHWRFEIIDMDRQRIDKILITKLLKKTEHDFSV